MADKTPDSFYQTVGFHFSVEFSTIPADSIDVRFQSVAGLDSSMNTENLKEGGENRFEHVLPTRRKYGPLVLKRGLLKPAESKLTSWLKKALNDGLINIIRTEPILF